MHTVNGLTIVSIPDLNRGFWTIFLDKEVNDSQQSSFPGANILTNTLQWDYLSALISIKRKCLQSDLAWKTKFVSLTTLLLSQTDPLKII
jgi:hypothetical protein